jgi:hypothetical protein
MNRAKYQVVLDALTGLKRRGQSIIQRAELCRQDIPFTMKVLDIATARCAAFWTW